MRVDVGPDPWPDDALGATWWVVPGPISLTEESQGPFRSAIGAQNPPEPPLIPSAAAIESGSNKTQILMEESIAGSVARRGLGRPGPGGGPIWQLRPAA